MRVMRRVGAENSEVRAQLLDMAERIIKEQGCGALTAGRLAERVGLKRQIVHYYFGTIDDLLLALIRRSGQRTRERLEQALETDNPLRVMWREGHYATTTSLEFIAMAARHDAARREIKGHVEQFRGLLAQALTRELERRGVKATIPPAVVAIVLMSISESLAVESTLGVTDAHAETEALFEAWLQAYTQDGALLERNSTQLQTQTAATADKRVARTKSVKTLKTSKKRIRRVAGR